MPASNVVQASLSPPVHNFVFLVTFVFLSVWLVKAFFRARSVWKLYVAVSKYNVCHRHGTPTRDTPAASLTRSLARSAACVSFDVRDRWYA